MTYDKWKTRSPDDLADLSSDKPPLFDHGKGHKKNFRQCTMPRDFLELADHGLITEMLAVAGFKFDHKGCPTKLTKPWATIENEDGSVTWTQWEVPQ